MRRELLLLKLRNAIADKEWATACANMETARAGQWTCDWYEGVRDSDAELRDIIKKLEAPSVVKRPSPCAGFDDFWRAYPKKKSKGQAEIAWAALRPSEQLQDLIVTALEQAKASDDWRRDGGTFIPYPATWLRAKGWEDSHGVEVLMPLRPGLLTMTAEEEREFERITASPGRGAGS